MWARFQRHLPSLPALLVLAVMVCALSGRAFATATSSPAPSLEAMAGQMLLVGFRGTGETPDDDEIRALLEDIGLGRIGGVILFEPDLQTGETRNITSVEQTARLASKLQEAAPIPLFVGVDQEGGKVRRFKEEHGLPETPSAEALGQGTPEATASEAAELGKRLHNAGVNLNFAPALDVNVNPASPAIGALGRSFSSDPAEVARHGLAFAQGMAISGVIACYKHFPGHGSASQDTHLGLTDVTATWTAEELEPYRRILPVTPPAMVMTAHIVHAETSNAVPATLSPLVITGLLRDGLGWQGVVVTDDLQMQAVEEGYTTKESIRLAVLAGADILLFGNNLRHDPLQGRKAHALLLELVREGSLSAERIQDSYQRIMTLKRQAGLLRP